MMELTFFIQSEADGFTYQYDNNGKTWVKFQPAPTSNLPSDVICRLTQVALEGYYDATHIHGPQHIPSSN